MDFVDRIVNGDKNKSSNKLIDKNLADKFDIDFNFNLPSIPPYEGI